MFDRGQLDLEFRFGSFGMELKNLQDKIHTIPNLKSHFSLFYFLDNSIDLARFEDITDNERICFQLNREIEDFIELAFSDVSTIIWFISFLQCLQDDDPTVRRNELFQLGDTIFEAKASQ